MCASSLPCSDQEGRLKRASLPLLVPATAQNIKSQDFPWTAGLFKHRADNSVFALHAKRKKAGGRSVIQILATEYELLAPQSCMRYHAASPTSLSCFTSICIQLPLQEWVFQTSYCAFHEAHYSFHLLPLDRFSFSKDLGVSRGRDPVTANKNYVIVS